IVIWNAIILHARWGGMIRDRGLAAYAVGGNIITSWSWFGTNLLGVGLHSYGFMAGAFYSLIGFIFSQLVVIGIACIPLSAWRAYQLQPQPSTPYPNLPEPPTSKVETPIMSQPSDGTRRLSSFDPNMT